MKFILTLLKTIPTMLLFAVTGLVAGLGWTFYNVIANGADVGIASLFVVVIGNVIGAYIVDFFAEKKGGSKKWFMLGFLFGIFAFIATFFMKKNDNVVKRNVFNSKRFFSIILHIALSAFLVVVFYPFLVGLFSSFKTQREILISPNILPETWQFTNYITAWTEANFAQYTFNTVYYTFFTIAVTVLTSTVNGYAFARGEFRGKSAIFLLFTALMFVTLGSSSLYPAMQLMKMFHLNTSLWGLIIKGFFAIHITDMYLVRGFINQLPKELDEAATIDGCGFVGIFFRIILPLLKPMVATLIILTFGHAWNDYLWPMIVTMGNPDAQPLSVGLRALKTSGEGAASWHIIMAGSMISALPMMIMYLIFNKYFVKGLAAGAVKG